tara:strand:- start:15129 stop:15818 length:690 start_codon:yes stop_codon:yes gene_type:complete
MKISKFKDIDNYQDRKDKKEVTDLLEGIKDSGETTAAEISNVSSGQQDIIDRLESVQDRIEKLPSRSDRTKIFSQKVEEDLIILETPDELFSIEQDCEDFFDRTSQLPEVNQFFILSEEARDDRCVKRTYNFDLEQPLAIRLDSYLGDENGFINAFGQLENKSSDITIINDTLYKLRLRMDDVESDISIEDGFSATFNDLENDNILSFKRDHTISGYVLNYVVEGKMNS